MSETAIGNADGVGRPDGSPALTRALIEVSAFSVLLIAVTALLVLTQPEPSESLPVTPIWILPVLALLFGLSLLADFYIEFRRHALSFALSEVPLALAVVFAPVGPGLGVRIGVSAIVLAAYQRPAAFKMVFNLSMFALEIAVAYRVMGLFENQLDIDFSSDASLVVSAVAATIIASVVGSIASAVAIARFEGDTLDHIGLELSMAWIPVVNGVCACILLSLALFLPVVAALTILPVGALWFSLRRYGEIRQRLHDLDDIHGFTGRIGQSLDPDIIARSAIVESARLMRAEAGALLLDDPAGPTTLHTTGPWDANTPIDPDDEFWTRLRSMSGARALPASDSPASHSASMIGAPVSDEAGSIGIIVLAGPGGVSRHFDADDLIQLQNLTAQLTPSLRRGMLHRRIEFEARHDGLTGLPNRAAFERYLDRVAAMDDQEDRAFLMMMDLDRFKEVNDTLGHHAGDDLLIEFAKRVSGRLGPDDFLCRLAGDEFAVVARCADEEAAFDLALACVEDAARPVTLDGLSIVITASVGIASIAADDGDPQTPLRHADIAMYNAKSRHIGVEFYRPELDRRTPARLAMLGDLREAIEQRDLGIEYQPKLDLASGLITGAEALVRWTHVVRGVVSPDEFIRVAEDTGLIKQLTDLMLARGIVQLREWHEQGHHLTLAVNLSTHDLLDSNLATRVGGYLRDNGVDPGSLTLEITESSLLIDAPRTQATIHELDELGVRLSIDDFGTGYSSLSYLRQLPVGELKVDQSFIANMLVDQQDEVIVRSTIDLGHNLGLEVVAEGVENDETLERLREFHCDVAQGYCVSRPLTAERLQRWLHTTHHPIRAIDPLEPQSWTIGVDAPGADPDSRTTDA